MNKQKINEIFERFSLKQPHPQIELEYATPFTLTVAVILSAQATDKSVNKVTPYLFAVADTPEKMVRLGEEKLIEFIKVIGLYRAKGKNIIALSKLLLEKFDSIIPEDFEELIKLPGIGRKSANVILNTFYKHPRIAVDTHVFRVSNRIKLCKTKNPLQTELALMKIIPDKWKMNAHHWLVLHGRYVCKARKPDCPRCLINDLCEYKFKTVENNKKSLNIKKEKSQIYREIIK